MAFTASVVIQKKMITGREKVHEYFSLVVFKDF